jgi:VWFA-related protein
MSRIAAFLTLIVLSLSTLAQQQPFEEKIDVNVVLLDVIVTDSRGNQILGLSKDDFIVKENGVTQPVESIDYFTNRRLLDQREESAPFKVERVREDRYFVFFFDKPSDNALFDQLTLARQAARDFVREEMMEGDRVAVAGHDIRLKVYSDFTSDKKQLEKALEDAAKFGRGLTTAGATEGPSILREIDAKAMINKTGTVYQAIDLLADSLRPIRARKNLVVFSPGIADLGEDVRGGMLIGRSRYLDPMLQSLNAANVSVYPVQLQRDVDTTPLFHQRLEEMAGETGGQYFRFNTSFKPALEKIENTNNGYYLLSYKTRHTSGEKGFQKVDVAVRNPELRVTARTGYQYGG